MGTQLPSPKKPSLPNFRPISVVATWLHGLRCHLVWRYGLGPGHIVLDVIDPPPPSLKGHSLPFSAHVRCGQTSGCMKTPLGTEIDLGPAPCHIVRRGPSSPPRRERAQHPSFRPMSIVAAVAHPSYCCMSSCYCYVNIKNKNSNIKTTDKRQNKDCPKTPSLTELCS